MQAPDALVHPLPVRITHWLNAVAILLMVLSGWRIYNASPLFDFSFPNGWTLGGWLAGALQWHFAAMWLLALNGLAYLAYGVLSGHLRRRLLPLAPRDALRELGEALRLRLRHADLSVYNAVQRLAYLGILVLAVLVILSGLVLWKPVQLQALGTLMGDYEGARYLHFFCMTGIALFIVVHVAMVAVVPRTLPAMITGRLKGTP
jgi:thiosulfate reductase cytochrome b subunit